MHSCLLCQNEGQKGYFTLPKNAEHRKTVVQMMNLSDWFLENAKPHHRICWRHYNQEQINYGGKYCTLKTGEHLSKKLYKIEQNHNA